MQTELTQEQIDEMNNQSHIEAKLIALYQDITGKRYQDLSLDSRMKIQLAADNLYDVIYK